MPVTAVNSFGCRILTLLKYDRTARPVPSNPSLHLPGDQRALQLRDFSNSLNLPVLLEFAQVGQQFFNGLITVGSLLFQHFGNNALQFNRHTGLDLSDRLRLLAQNRRQRVGADLRANAPFPVTIS